jgi:hypothetical protein
MEEHKLIYNEPYENPRSNSDGKFRTPRIILLLVHWGFARTTTIAMIELYAVAAICIFISLYIVGAFAFLSPKHGKIEIIGNTIKLDGHMIHAKDELNPSYRFLIPKPLWDSLPDTNVHGQN